MDDYILGWLRGLCTMGIVFCIILLIEIIKMIIELKRRKEFKENF